MMKMAKVMPPAGRVLVVDDAPGNLEVLIRLMRGLGYAASGVESGEDALAAVARSRPDIVLLDVNMPGMNGFEVCRRLKRDPSTRLLPVVLITGLSEREDRLKGIDAGADDFLTKPLNVQELEARVRSLTRLKQYTDELDSAESVILSLGLTIEARDPYTQGHCQRLTHYAALLSDRLNLSDEQRIALHRGSILHDVGKVGIPDAVLLKMGCLTSAEHEVMQQHTVIGHNLCGDLRALRAVRPIVRHHHERLDGSGYPDGLAGDAIPLLAQIVSVIDVYDAITTPRPYRAAQSPEFALRELKEEARRGWKRRDLVEAFVSLRDLLSTSAVRITA